MPFFLMSQKIRADQLVFNLGLAESREKAKSLIMAGRVIFNGQTEQNQNPQKVLKPGQQLPPDTSLALLEGREYVSRGAYKLITLLDGFNINVQNMVCLDAGASTGGFTDCLLRRGARKVYAVDVGKNQLHEKLKADSRVISMEGINLRSAYPALLPEKVDLLTGDLSFISLTLVLPNCLQWLKIGGLAAVLIKPQFELSPREVRKGVVREEALRQKAIARVVDFCQSELLLEFGGILPASIKGPKGNQEYMALFKNRGI